MIGQLNTLQWLQQYYLSCCDGDWEHGEGYQITTLDNPGWYLRLHLYNGELIDQPFDRIEVKRSNIEWYHCWKEGEFFHAAGGPLCLGTILEIFRAWVEQSTTSG